MLDVYPETQEADWLQATQLELTKTGWAAEVYDSSWNLVWVSDELKNFLGFPGDIGLGEHILDLYQKDVWKNLTTPESSDEMMHQIIPFVLHDSEGVQVEGYEPSPPPPFFAHEVTLTEDQTKVKCLSVRILSDGRHVGTARVYGPALRASVLSVVAQGDTQQFEMITRLSQPGQRRAAVLFADIEGSTALSRVLPSSTYFDLVAEIISEIDEIILKHGGLVGKHAGDGASAFFIGDEHGAASSAVRAAIVASREIHETVRNVAKRKADVTGLHAISNLKMKVALHWGDTLYIGQISTKGRLDVTALGDEANDAARMEAAAKGGQTLASKALIERLNESDAKFLGIDIATHFYKQITDLISEGKAARDNVNLAVCDLSRKSP